MNKSLRANSFDKSQKIFTSFKGYEFHIHNEIWVLDINVTLNLMYLKRLKEDIQHDALFTLSNFAQYSSSSHTANMNKYIAKYIEITDQDHFSVEGLLNYKIFYSSKKDEYKVAMLRVFLKKLYDLGYASVDDEIYDLMDSWRLSGNEKGAAVLSLDPDEGPFKESVSKNATGATVWLETRELTIKRCEKMIALLDDPNIPDGTPLSIPPSEDVTHLDLAYQKAGRKRIPTIENIQRKKLKEQIVSHDSLSLDLWS